jgi:plastocyanin
MPHPAHTRTHVGMTGASPAPAGRARRPRLGARRSPVALVLAAFVAVVAVGCGGGSTATPATPGSATETPAGTTVQLAADPTGRLEFDPQRLEAPAGEVTIAFTNDSSVVHDVAVVGKGVFVKSKRVANGEKTSVSARFAPGTYEYYCTVPGHQDAGMQGILAVS